MKIIKIILISIISNIFCQRDKLQIININNPNFQPKEIENLIFGFNLMKHGASSPCIGLNDHYIDIFDQKWDGYCELTKKGYLQLFKLGKIYQQRYSRLLNISEPEPDINKVKSFASQANKTLMSSNALFYGMYIKNHTPIEQQLIVPVRNFKKSVGNELTPIFYYTERKKCQTWKKFVDNNLNKNSGPINGRLMKFYNSYNKVFNLLKNDIRMINSNTLLEKIDLMCNAYISNYYDDRYHNIKIFKTLNFNEEQFYNLYYDCIEISLFRYINVEYGEDGQKVPMIVLSDLIYEMIFYMDEIIKNPDNTKFVTYIGHDYTLAAMQVILEKGFNIPPKMMNFASNQIFLLYKDPENENENDIEKRYTVKYFYNDQLSMITEYADFKKNLLKLMKTENDLEFFCEGFKPHDYIFLGLSSAIIILIFTIINTFCYHRNTFVNKKKYMSLDEESREKSIEIKNN